MKDGDVGVWATSRPISKPRKPHEKIIHVYPTWQKHFLAEVGCYCDPKIQKHTGGNLLIIHNDIKTC